MPTPATDHRRATAERNVTAILDATERLARERRTLSMAAVAAEAGVSRVTLYAHFARLQDVVEAAVERGVEVATSALDAANVADGPADVALGRMIDASWMHLARQDALARAAVEHVPPQRLHRAHEPLLARLRELLRRGQDEGVFRTDLPLEWLAHVIYTLFHAAADHARDRGIAPADAGEMVQTTIRDVVRARPAVSA
jgi:AcrR family transcriptional regulator